MRRQDATSSPCGAAARRALSPQDLADAGIVRSWSQRGTHHLLPARDVR
ncbi:MAG: hypothetical protein L0J74_01395 [Corynebacterium sp.]|nr:hypothetical protein [Corynebacterium sp.]MDN5722522.1 hypothetical protein [Corynebacterium sp.]MDN6281526.1 hypothetical protein [Corynebacterium sp.]MDN6304452.1 hypothetical protein [Corynebacterium sp.]MDN6353015.1 hypothetical protein [Corynebacterium sp.]MDN6366349.1 hypothetical protein [Corynebacterium sp.]